MISTLISSTLVRDNLREVIFTITDDQALVHGPRIEFRPASEVVSDFLAAQVSAISISLRDGEIAQNISEIITLGKFATPRLRYSSAAQNFAALRLVYELSSRIEAVMIGDFLGSLTDAQLRTAFSMTQAQVTTLRANKLTPATTLADQIRASAGQ